MAGFVEEDWSDIIRIPQDDGPLPVVKIKYSQEFVTLMDIFRGVISKGEHSERVLSLTQEILEVNPGSYTVWQYRRACLKALNSDLMKELEYLDSFANENPKNYQIWQHRRVIVDALGTGNFEKKFCEKIFEEDAKNYHAWAHRQWTVKTFNLWAKEIDFVNQCLEDDMRNNSVWNYRWFVVHEDPAGYTDESIAAEVDFVSSMIVSVSKNESAWNYLRGLSNRHPIVVHKIVNWIYEFMSQNSECAKNIFALGLLADLKENEGTQESVESSIELFKILIDVDPMRIKSWTRRVHLASAKLEIATKV